VAARKSGLEISEGNTFNQVITFTLEPGYYHLTSNIISIRDIADPEEVHSNVYKTIDNMARLEKEKGCIPLCASNTCDWNSAYAKSVGANVGLREAVITACVDNNIVLTGGETANLSNQLREKGMSWMFTLLSRYEGPLDLPASHDMPYNSVIDSVLQGTFRHIADKERFEIRCVNGMPLLHVKVKSQFLMTADGTGSKSIVCELVGDRTDIEDTLAAAGDDSPREGAFPVLASIGIHSEHHHGKVQILRNMIRAGERHSLPILGSVFHQSDHVYTYAMNGVILSAVTEGNKIGAELVPGLYLVLLYEIQRTNGITLQRRVLEETFGPKWYNIKVSDALKQLSEKLGQETGNILRSETDKTLGELVCRPSTPYFRTDSLMPKELLDTIRFRVNASSGGLTGKTRRALEQSKLGADYFDLFDVPELILILQMASRVDGSEGMIPDEIAYYTWGCGNGAVVGTTHPEPVADYYRKSGILAKVGGKIIAAPEIRIRSRAFDSMQKAEPHILVHKYTELALG
jgi:phosphoribosylaminoimidazole (AIR) synthetase